MSLVGNLEDLGLGDILQIVSLSRKSGALILEGPGLQGKMFFQDGQVTRATSSLFMAGLGDILVRKGVVDLETLKGALHLQRRGTTRQSLGAILGESFGVPKDAIEQVAREQVEKIVFSFFGWAEGTFAFELGGLDEACGFAEEGGAGIDPPVFFVEEGLNPQWLAMEGSRLLDEKRHRGEPLAVREEPTLNLEALLAEGADSAPPMQAPVPSPSPSLVNIGAELLSEMGELDQVSLSGKGSKSPGLHLLKGMLQELSNPSLGGGVVLLILRFASEVMNRAVIFSVKENEIVGLGQFGIEFDREMADVRIRGMKIPREEPSRLTEAVREFSPCRVRPGDSPWDAYLQKQLGGGVPEEIFLGPILSEGRVVALIYGDNLPEKKPIGDTEAFEIFLSQAGLAMERAIIERRLVGGRV
ncbi:MAG: diguanylate cyclase [Desulfuromonas sp.]|uniref:DUF4388 domain-containing protein n=1 Tax=Desulfuromonas sp. TaxID=892 RepID=UPI000CB6F394|nr:DUF4388 domain-containing protein [Desulfuromonas sp.]PLX82578.1 MAG: diguanylate cyclase [Desulfuromonas sp.]